MLDEKYLWEMMSSLFQKYEVLISIENSLNFQGLNYSEVHTLDFIEKIEDANVTKLADEMNMTRGALSKITKKLLNKDLISSYKSPKNKKEIYFKLTEAGLNIFKMHEKIHKEALEREMKLFSSFNEEERETIDNFMRTIKNDMDRKIKNFHVK